MNEKDQELGFTLEDILKEFGSEDSGERDIFTQDDIFAQDEPEPEDEPAEEEEPLDEFFEEEPEDEVFENEPEDELPEEESLEDELFEEEPDISETASQDDIELDILEAVEFQRNFRNNHTEDDEAYAEELFTEPHAADISQASAQDADEDFTEDLPLQEPAQTGDDLIAETEPPLTQAQPSEEPAAEEADEDSSFESDTIRLDADKIDSASHPKPGSSDEQTVLFEAISEESMTQEESDEAQDAPLPEGAEPFSNGWEPEYEQPIGEYTPPEPLVFRPRSQLQTLKRKLVAGPERRYYALVEMGLGKLQISIFLSLLVVALSAASIGMHQIGLVQPNRMRLLVFGEIFAMLFSALLASNRLLDGFLSIFKGKFTLDTMLVASFLVCMADGYFCLKEVRVPFCSAFCLETTMSLWAEFQRRSTELGQMDTLRKATRLNRVAKAPNCFEDSPGFYVTNGELEDFMDTYQQTTGPEKLLSVYAFIALIASGAIAVLAGLSHGVSAAMQVWSAGILAATPVTIFISQSRPMVILEHRLHKLGTVLCGWQGVKAATGAAAVPLSDEDLLPSGSAKINGVKFYTNREPDQVIAYAAALIHRSGNCLDSLFEQLLDNRNGRHYDVVNFRSYENGGLGGEVCDESILLGTIPFLQEMGVETPEGARVNQAVYMSIDGELCAVFALAFGKLKGVSASLGTLGSYRGLTPVLRSENFLLSESFIHAKFGVNTRRYAFLPLEQRRKVAAWTPDPAQSIPCALTTQEGVAGVAFAITGGRSLHTASILGAFVHIFGGVLGLLIILALTIVQSSGLLTPANLLLFELVWAIPGLLITEWTRNI